MPSRAGDRALGEAVSVSGSTLGGVGAGVPPQLRAGAEQKEGHTMASRRVQVYERRDGVYGWRRLSSNNNITATSGEGYNSAAGAERAAKRENPGLPVVKQPKKRR